MDIDELNLSERAYNVLRRHGITDTDELCRYTEDEISHIRGCGVKTMIDIKDCLARYGLELGSNRQHIWFVN